MAGSPRVTVVGAGSWGTAFATIPAGKGVETVLWARREELAGTIAALATTVAVGLLSVDTTGWSWPLGQMVR